MNWLDELRHLVELYRAELGEIVAAFLLSIPFTARLPLGKLARVGREANWGEVTSSYNLCIPLAIEPIEALWHIYIKPVGVVVEPEYVEVSYTRYTKRLSLGSTRLWRLAYVAILAWHEEHVPIFDDEPELPADPAERLEVLREQIRNADAGYDMSPVLAYLSELGEQDKVTASTLGGSYRISTKRLLTHCEQNDTLIHYADRNTICFTLVGGTKVEARISDHINTIAAEILARRGHLALKWPD